MALDLLNPQYIKDQPAIEEQEQSNPVSIAESDPDKPVAIDTGGIVTQDKPSDDTAIRRSYKASAGIGELVGKSYADIHDDIANGNEKSLRTQAASMMDYHNQVDRENRIREATQQAGRTLTIDEVNQMLVHKPTNPSDVLERGYAHHLMRTIDDANERMGNGTTYQSAKEQTPGLVEQAKQQTNSFAAAMERARTEAEDLQDRLGKQSTIGYIADFGKTMVQPYDEWKTRNLVTGGHALEGGGGLGSNWDEQTGRLMMKSQDEQNAFWSGPEWTKLKDDNPQLALQFLNSYLGQTSTDRILGNLNSLTNIPLGLSALKAGSLLIKPMRDLNFVRNGYRQVLEASQRPNPTAASEAAAAGDLKTAAVKQVMSNTAEDLGANAQESLNRRTIDALPNVLRSDSRKLYEDAPAREVVNRIDQMYENNIQMLIDHETDALKVPHAQEVYSSEAAMKKILDKAEESFPGKPNTILEHNGPFVGRGGSKFGEMKIGNEKGLYFNTWEEAYGHALLNKIVPKTPPEYIASVNEKIATLAEEIKNPPDMNADVNELNRFADIQNQHEALVREQREIERRGPDGYAIKNQGNGFYISYIHPINETDLAFRQFVGSTLDSKLQPTWMQGWARWLRTPAETLSQLENQARIIATHGPSLLLEKFTEASRPIRKLSNRYHEDWNKALDFAQKAIDPDTKRNGYFFQNITDMESWYQTHAKNGRLPSDEEIEAYFAFKGNYEAARQLRITHLLTLKDRMGAQQHSVSVLDKDGKTVHSPFVEGVIQKEAPGGQDTVLVMGNRLGDERLMGANHPGMIKIKAEIEKGGKGWQVMRVIDPDRTDEGSLRGFGKVDENTRTRWVVSKRGFETKQISYENQINRVGGGHFIPETNYYIKYPRMSLDPITGHQNYAGDVTVMSAPDRAAAEAMVKHLDEITNRLKFNNIKRARDYHTANKIPIPFEDIQGWFKSKKGQPARLRMGDKFQTVEKNKTIPDTDNTLKEKYGDDWRDRTHQGSDMRQAVVEFAGERDAYELYQVEDLGSRGNPLYKYEPAKLMDPIPAYNRALSRLINNMYTDHYKINAVEHWIQQASKLLKGDKDDMLHSPYTFFSKPEWLPNADPIEVSNLMSAKYNIDQFVGVPSKLDTHLNAIANKLADSVYKNVSPKAANLITNAWQLHYVRNPIAFLRSVTFHDKMGLFSIPQFFMQFFTGANVLAIGGAKHFNQAMSGTYFYQISRLNSHPEIIAELDKRAVKMGWKPGEYTEFHNLTNKNTGFVNIGGEHAFKDEQWSAKIIKNMGQDILDWGEFPFREGAKNTRILSMAMAYREFREGPKEGKGIVDAVRSALGEERPNTIFRRGNKFGKLTDEDKASILQRAADLDHNMSRAANSMTHTGIMAPFGQFTAYSTRLMELMTGKRLTWQEKARLFGVSSLLYGVPAGGVGLYGLPMGDYLRDKAKDAGYVVGENFVPTVINDGMLSALTGVITGTNVNFSAYGARGIDPVGEVLWTDSSVYKVIGGAAASTLGNIWMETEGLRSVFISHLRGDNVKYPLTADETFGFLKEITTVNALERLIIALNTQKWASKNGLTIQDNVSATKALLQTFSGRVDQKVADVTVNIKSQQAQAANRKWVESEYPLHIQRAMTAMGNKDWTTYENEMKKAKWVMDVAGDYPVQLRPQLIQRAVQENIELITRLEHDRALGRNVPASKQTPRLQTLQDQIKHDEQQGNR